MPPPPSAPAAADTPLLAATPPSQRQQQQRRRRRWRSLRRRALSAVRWAGRRLVGINALLICAPLGLVAGPLHWHPVLASACNFLAIMPLSAIIADASDALADSWGMLAGALVNATFGNTVELIVGCCYSLNPPLFCLSGF